MSEHRPSSPTLPTTPGRPLGFLVALLLLWMAFPPGTGEAQDGKPGLPTPQQPLKKGDGWLGVGLKTLPLEDARKRGFAHSLVLVDNVFKGSPAAASGFEIGDVILKYNGTTIKEVQALVQLVRGTAPGTQVSFVVMRGKKKLTKPLLLALRPDRLEMVRSQFLDQPAPDFAVTQVNNGTTLKLSDHKGKVMVIDFWATWCGPCRRAIPHMNKLNKEHAKDGLVVVGISDEDKATIRTFASTTPMHYTLASDPEKATNRNYMVTALPTLFIIDHEGIIRDVVVGGGQFDAVDKKVKDLLAKRRAAQQSKP